jgi:hypothetical protein
MKLKYAVTSLIPERKTQPSIIFMKKNYIGETQHLSYLHYNVHKSNASLIFKNAMNGENYS